MYSITLMAGSGPACLYPLLYKLPPKPRTHCFSLWGPAPCSGPGARAQTAETWAAGRGPRATSPLCGLIQITRVTLTFPPITGRRGQAATWARPQRERVAPISWAAGAIAEEETSGSGAESLQRAIGVQQNACSGHGQYPWTAA